MSTYALGSQADDESPVVRVGEYESLARAQSAAVGAVGWVQTQADYWTADGGVIQQVSTWHVKRTDT